MSILLILAAVCLVEAIEHRTHFILNHVLPPRRNRP